MILQKCEKVNKLEEIQEKLNEVNVEGFICPNCRSREFNYYGNYKRFLIVLVEKETREIEVKIKRIKCKVCGKTHAVIPDFIVPYKIYGIEMINEILNLKINEGKQNKEIEKKYKVSRQLLRKWIIEFEKIKSKVKMIKEKIKITEIKMERYYREYLEIYMMRRKANYCYAST